VLRLHQADAAISGRSGVGRLAKLVYKMKTVRFVIAILAVAPGCFVMGQANGASCIADHYKVVALPLRPARVNEARQVAGTTTGHRAALWTEQTGLRELPLPEGFYNSEAAAVNDSGHVAGVAYDRVFSHHRAFTFANDVLTLLPGEQSHTYNINDSDEVAGESLLPGKTTTVPVVWVGTAIRSLGGCCGGSAKGINNNGEAIGDIYDANGRYQAFLWTASRGIHPIGPPDRYSSAIAMNADGHVVVQAFSEVFLYAGGNLTHLDLSSRYPSQPHAINNCDVIVGSFGPFADAERAFIWDKSRGFRDLNTGIASDSGWTLESANSINDHGEIVGRGDYKGQEDTGFLLIPGR
jgi:probable HAF family extracellular repeat protein